MEPPQLGKEHRWLERLVGEWEYEVEAPLEPGGEPQKQTGTESVRSLEGAWVLCEARGTMGDGAPALTVMTLGFDPRKQRFVGTFIGSMMTHLWIYEGELDASGNVLALDTEGPSFAREGQMGKYRDFVEWKGDDERLLRSEYLGDDGQWQEFMQMRYRRR